MNLLAQNLPLNPAPARLVSFSGIERRKEIVEFIRKHPDATCSKICQNTGYEWKSVEHDLSTLMRAGLIHPAGKNPGKWRVA